MIPDITELSIVFLGNFNPSIFNPSWLVKKEFLTEEEAKNQDIEIINPHLSKFKVDWADFEITDSRVQIRSTDGTAFEALRDLGINIFNVLDETPLNAIGINHIHHYQLKSKQKYLEFGNILAPLNNWDEILENPKLFRLEMVQEEREDGFNGSKRIRVTPSNLVKPYGVRIDINNHFELEDFKEMDEKLSILSEENWANASDYVTNVTETILRKTNILK